MNKEKQLIRNWLLIFIAALFISGLTAMPVESELNFIVNHFPFEGSIKGFLQEVLAAIQYAGRDYPFLFYGYDWLAFAHFALAILFIGPLKDPVKNKWVIEFGIITCLLIIPFALVAGHFRGLPLWWRLVDCSFGIIGLLPLIICLQKIKMIEAKEKEETENKQEFNLLITQS